jgi:hypothetical protein
VGKNVGRSGGGVEEKEVKTIIKGETNALTSSATCPRESVLTIRLQPDFLVVFEGYAGEAEHRP